MKVKRNVFAAFGWVAWNVAGVLGVKYAIDKLTGRGHHPPKQATGDTPQLGRSAPRSRWRRRRGRGGPDG